MITMTNMRLLVVAFALCMSVKFGEPRAIPACNSICSNAANPKRCCGFDQKDILAKGNFPSQQSNSIYGSLFRQKPAVQSTTFVHYTLHDGFTDEEKTVIGKAMQFVVNRLFTSRVRDCMYRKTGENENNSAAAVLRSSNVNEGGNYNGYKDLLRFQLDCLELKALHHTFPSINIQPWYEESNRVGKATVGSVTIASQGPNCLATGEFNLWLNRYRLATPARIGFNANYWAGVIAHEMLHNLGHSHANYSDNWKINAFERCLMSDGTDDSRVKAS